MQLNYQYDRESQGSTSCGDDSNNYWYHPLISRGFEQANFDT
jgi:hypothetical protein